ncbi:MAG: glycosyltransferase [Balneolaceae bacterium]
MPKKLKVFHGLVNYGTQAGLLAKEFRDLGVEAKSYTKYDRFNRQTDYQFKKKETLLEKAFYYKVLYPLVRLMCFFKYNTFHFYFGQSLFKNQRDLPLYRLFNKKVIMEYLGNDIRHYKSLVERYDLPESHDYYQRMEVHDSKVRQRVHRENKYIDYLISCLPTHVDFAKEYNVEVKEVVPLAVDVNSIIYMPFKKKNTRETITILHAPTSRVFKGTIHIEKAIEKLKSEGYNVEFRLVEGVSHEELFREYRNCDIFIDQISVGWYGTAALEAMVVGRPTCAFIDERYYQYIDYAEEIPVVNINKETITDQLRNLIDNSEKLPELGKRSREFVEKYHDVKNVCLKLINIYKKKVWGEEL